LSKVYKADVINLEIGWLNVTHWIPFSNEIRMDGWIDFLPGFTQFQLGYTLYQFGFEVVISSVRG